MIVARAKVKYFRSIVNTGWVELDSDITTLLGKNESGKSSFLRALESVSDEDPIDERDINYNQSPDKEPFEMVRLELMPEDGSDVIEFGALDLEVPLYIIALVKYIVGESENCSDNVFQCLSTGFAKDSSPKLERSEIRCEFVL
ncbi:hypothetical protein JCM18237_17000 [Halorubrum luteum]